ncbi:VPA1269 family protein [Polaromonas sp. CG_23.6]|uniref:gamma-mobile-trio integrase GmtZ n=1 Tax=Polaromonas sp. CG_23.6 TaxID=2760709 RepID=UPI002475C2B8|nr:VPA1269 family protein [Polaromonas sp. CG_23.6]MDH6182649.1 DNA invertase Pin-like site-specific DNA recombinase [Polaromonas sp. CG_23.6]
MKKKKTFTPEQMEYLISRVEAGETRAALAKEMGVSYSILAKAVPTGFRHFTPEEHTAAIARVESGESRADVAASLNCDKSTVGKWTMHLPKETFSWTPELKATVLQRLGKGERTSLLARDIGVKRGVVDRLAIAAASEATEEQLQAIIAAQAQNKTVAQIAADLQIAKRTVNLALGIEYKTYSDDVRQAAIKAIEGGATAAEVARTYRVSETTVTTWHRGAVVDGSAQAAPIRISKKVDTSCSWINRDHPGSDMERWRVYASEWLKGETSGLAVSIRAIAVFIEKYLVAHQLPTEPSALLSKASKQLPDFYAVACPQSNSGVAINNRARDFLQYVLKTDEFSEEEEEEEGERNTSPAYRNPIAQCEASGEPRRSQSDKTVLPYALIVQLRSKMVGGANFSDWSWVRSLSGKAVLDGTTLSTEWFAVPEDHINKNDPDCVWQRRTFINGQKAVFEMWSPVRWVGILMKLLTPGRTGQWRMADSGESDTKVWRNGKWVLNDKQWEAGLRQLWRQGVLRQMLEQGAPDQPILYFNSNKTADKGKRGKDMGMDCPWMHSEDITADPYYWLEKLRNWQEEYNPISVRTSWRDIPDARSLGVKHDLQKAQYPDACFLFRTPETPQEAQFPLSNGMMDAAWQKLLAAFEESLATEAQVHADGSRIELLDKNGRAITSLHGMRVSLITHFIMHGDMQPELMMKIVGHARMIMTIYYTKPGMSELRDALTNAHLKLDAEKEARLTTALKNMQGEQLRDQVVFNADDWRTVVAVNPTDRSPVGWLHMHDGICLAGGNTGPLDGNGQVPGCHNGGILIRAATNEYGPVPGGTRNCPQCRWKCAGKEHGYGVQATLNNRFYHLHKAGEKALVGHRLLQSLKQEKARAEAGHQVFEKMRSLKNAEKVHEQAMVRMSVLAVDVARLHRTIERIAALPSHTDGTLALAAHGDLLTMQQALEEVDSELLVLSNICEDVQFFPELDPGVAVFERSHLLDKALEREGQPPYFARLTEGEQLIYGNAFMQALERQVNPGHPLLARRDVVKMIDTGEGLSRLLGGHLNKFLPKNNQADDGLWLRVEKVCTNEQ